MNLYQLLGETVHYVPEAIPDFLLDTMTAAERREKVAARAEEEFAAIITVADRRII